MTIQKYMPLTHDHLMTAVDDLVSYHEYMRNCADSINSLLKELSDKGYDQKTMKALADLCYEPNSVIFKDAIKHLKSTLHEDEPAPTGMPCVKPKPSKMPGL